MRNKKNDFVYTDTALEEIQSVLESKKEWDAERGTISSSIVEYFVTVKGVRIRLWFNADTQMYGFDMLNGGIKARNTLPALLPLLESYVQIHTDLVPIAKMIALEIDNICEVKTLFKGVNGNNSDGYSVIFNIINSDGTVFIRKDGEEYIADVLKSSDADKEEYKFTTDGDSVVLAEEKKRTPFEEMLEGYDVIPIEIGSVRVGFYSDSTEIILRDTEHDAVELLGCTSRGKNFDFLTENPIIFDGYNMEDILELLRSEHLDAMLLLKSLCQNFDVEKKDAEITDEGVLVINGDDITCIEDYVNSKRQLNGIDSLVKESQDTPDEAGEEKPDKETQVMNPPEDNGVVEDTSISVTKLVYNEKVIGVQIRRDTELYNIASDIAESIGLNPERILGETTMYARNGVLVSEDEIKLHRFAKKIEESADIYNLLDCLF